jgi:hypothetical protein
MKRAAIILAVLGLAFGFWKALNHYAPSTVDYRGEHIRLTRYYLDYDDYKNDPNNIDPSETTRVQNMIIEAPIARSFKTKREASQAVGEISFPGYGSGGISGETGMDDPVIGFSIEIPRSEKSRYFTFRKTVDGYVLIDDFTDSTMPGITRVRQVGETLVYSMDGRPEQLARTPFGTPPPSVKQ